MRWDALFDDLEAQWAELDRRALQTEAAELTRGEWSRLGLADRLRGGIGRTMRLRHRRAERQCLPTKYWCG